MVRTEDENDGDDDGEEEEEDGEEEEPITSLHPSLLPALVKRALCSCCCDSSTMTDCTPQW